MAGQGVLHLAGFNGPEPNGVVVPARGEQFAVGGEGDGGDAVGVAGQGRLERSWARWVSAAMSRAGTSAVAGGNSWATPLATVARQRATINRMDRMVIRIGNHLLAGVQESA
jgi:hypothetical protein